MFTKPHDVPTAEEIELLLREAERYLDAVDTFRSESAEPTWLTSIET